MKYPFDISERLLVEKMLKGAHKYYKSLTKDNKLGKSRKITYEIKREKYFGSSELAIWSQQKTTEEELIQTKIELESLQQLERLKTELLSTVSHELRTPLTSIKGLATTLLRPDVKWSNKEQIEFLQGINQETDRLNRLIGDLLDMSRLEAGVLKLGRERCRVSDLIESVRGELGILTKEHQLEIAVPHDLPVIYIDKMRIGQVITNLVENSVRYSDKGSRIKIEVKPDNSQVVISVTDHGRGIPKQSLDKVFNRFYSTDYAVNARSKGLGLGLSICRSIIESHGGQIWAESELGKGSKFSFSLATAKKGERYDKDSSSR